MHWLPESIVSAYHISVTLAAAAVASESVVVNVFLIVAVQGPRERAGLSQKKRGGIAVLIFFFKI